MSSSKADSLLARRKSERDRRESVLKKRSASCLDFEAIPSSLRCHIFGDYLDDARLRPNAKLKDVVANVQAYERFISHEGSQLPHLFKRFKEDEEGFDAYYQSLQRLSVYSEQALGTEWARMSSFLSPWEVKALRRASPTFAITRMVKYCWVKQCLDHAISTNYGYSEGRIL